MKRKIISIRLIKLPKESGGKKFEAYFRFEKLTDKSENRQKYLHKMKVIKFGSADHEDYTIHKNRERKRRYLSRHKKNEDWDNLCSAGALSRWLLWNKPTLRESISYTKKKFGVKIIY